MQIIIDQSEIEEALENYIHSQISVNEDQEISIDLKAGRGENGYSATIEIRAAQTKKSKPAKKPVTRATKKPDPTLEPVKGITPDEGSEEAPVAEPENSETTAPASQMIGADEQTETPTAEEETTATPSRTSIFSKTG